MANLNHRDNALIFMKRGGGASSLFFPFLFFPQYIDVMKWPEKGTTQKNHRTSPTPQQAAWIRSAQRLPRDFDSIVRRKVKTHVMVGHSGHPPSPSS